MVQELTDAVAGAVNWAGQAAEAAGNSVLSDPLGAAWAATPMGMMERGIEGVAGGVQNSMARTENSVGNPSFGDYAMGMAADALGLTGIAEGVYGTDTLTGQKLDGWERGGRIATGVGQAAGIAAGGMAARATSASSTVMDAADAAKAWLGEGGVVKPTRGGGLVVQSKDGMRQIRLDLRGHGRFPPHAHIETRNTTTGRFRTSRETPHHIYFSDRLK